MSATSSPSAVEQRTLTIDGHRVWYRQAGTGLPLVHLHGAGGPAWDPAHELLAGHFRVIAPAMPGFGESESNPTLDTLPATAQFMAEFIRQVSGGRSHVMGSSFGGRVATWLAIQTPDVIDRLVLESPASFRPPGGPPLSQLTPADLRAPGAAVDRGVEQFTDRQAQTQNLTAIEQLTRNNPPEDALLARLVEIQTPTLALFGTEDRLIPPENGRIYKERIADCNIAFVYQAGHIIRRDRPEAFAHIVSEFLERGPAFLVNRG